jgi:predicted nucleic acid-binding protein
MPGSSYPPDDRAGEPSTAGSPGARLASGSAAPVRASVWIEHLRAADERIIALLDDEEILAHPLVMGEVPLGDLRERDSVLRAFWRLPQATVATDEEVLRFIDDQSLFGRGTGYIDAHLLAAARLTTGTRLRTRDRRLERVATELGLAAALPH